MKGNVGQIGVVVAVVAVLALLVGGYFMFVKGPAEVSPEDTKSHMMGQGKQEMEKAYQKK